MKEVKFSKFDLAGLPRRAIVALAARCARRVQPIFDACPLVTPNERTCVKDAIDLAEGYAAGTCECLGPIGFRDLIEACYAASDLVKSQAAAWNAAESARYAVSAAHNAQEVGDKRAAGSSTSASAACALEAQALAENDDGEKALAQINADYEFLLAAKSDQRLRSGMCVPPEFFS